ncbi:hypothetical protein [Streptomyces litmocidini]|uniref:Uncharacterized protein n=1 Tax=Streptomyces litmocidini TaxID=67318 RepID=A0ABW7U190_9ACTN
MAEAERSEADPPGEVGEEKGLRRGEVEGEDPDGDVAAGGRGEAVGQAAEGGEAGDEVLLVDAQAERLHEHFAFRSWCMGVTGGLLLVGDDRLTRAY